MSGRSRSLILLFAIVLFLAVFLVWPLAYVFRKAFHDANGFTIFYMKALLTDPLQLQAIGTSLTIATFVTFGCLIVALPPAWLVARRSFPGKSFVSAFMLIPLILPPFVGAVGIKILFARSGALSTLLLNLGIVDGPVDWLGKSPMTGIVIMEVMHLFPILYLNLVAALANIDPSLEEAASNLGASPWRVFKRISMPLAGPGLFGGLILVFIWSFTELGTPLVFGLRRVLPVMIYDSISEVGTNPIGYAQVVLILVIAAMGFWISKHVSKGRGDVATLGRLSVSSREKPLSPVCVLLTYVLLGTILFIAVLPHISVVLISCSRRWFLTVLPQEFTLSFFGRAINSEMTQTALVNSLGLSLCASILDVFLGFSIAWLCVRTRIKGIDMLDTLAMLPLAVPGLVIAFGYLGCFSGMFPNTYLDPRFNPMLLLIASYSIRRLPYMVRAAHAGLQQTSRTYEEAAANLGASPLRVIRRITLPLIAANLLAGGILCFAFSMLEVADSMILAQTQRFYPITKAIYVLIDMLENGVNVAAALGVWSMSLLGSAMLWVSCLLGKKMGQMFRVS